MRATIIAIGSRGDVQPYVALGLGLVRAGHDVTVATHDRFRSLVEDHGVAFATVAEGALSQGVETEEGRRWVEDRSRWMPGFVGLLEDAASVAHHRLADCRRASADADVVVASLLGTLLGLQMADELGIPLIRAYYAPVGWPAHPIGKRLLWQSARPWVNKARAAEGLAPLPWREPFSALDARGVPTLYGYSPAVSPRPESWDDTSEITGYWMLDHPDQWAPSDALADFIAAGPPPVLVTFGANIDRDPVATAGLFTRALERAGQRGILVHDLHETIAPHLPDTVFATDFVPYDWLFPRLAAVVHHGGAGSTAFGLRAGVPAVIIPAFADQPFWAGRVHDLGVGPAPIPRKQLSAERLGDAIHQAVTDEGIRRRCAALAERLQAEDGVGTAVKLIERHVAEAATFGTGEPVGTRARPSCPLCGSAGTVTYRRVHDRLYDVPGHWGFRRCDAARCGALWMDPAPREDEIGKVYREYYTHEDSRPPRLQPFVGVLHQVRRAYLKQRFGYDLGPIAGERVLGAAAGALLSALPGGRDAMDDTACHLAAPAAGARLLEVGFGSAQQLRRMQALGWEVTGVDADAAAVESARAHGLDVHVGELAAQRFADATFDAVYLSHVIEHVHAPVELLAECHRVLKPGGQLVVITPNVASWGHRTFRSSWFALEPPRHLVLFTPDALRATASRAGFARTEVRTSARITFITWIGSADIEAGGSVVSFDGAVPLGRLARGAAAQVAESTMLLARPDAGEELVGIAWKPTIRELAPPDRSVVDLRERPPLHAVGGS